MIFEYATDSATLYLPTGPNKKGVQQFEAGAAVTVRFEPKSKLFVNNDGSQEQADGTAFIPGSVTPQIGAKLTVDGTDYKIVLLNTRRDLEGEKFYSATLQEMKGAG